MGINDILKKLREDLTQAVANINADLSDPSLTGEAETHDQKRMQLLADIQNSLQQQVTKLDAPRSHAERGNGTKGVTKSRLIDFLNTLLETEYDAIFSYSYHALSVSDKELSRELLDFGIMEMRHFEILRDKIVSFGVEPKWKLTKYMECSAIKPVEMLLWHLNAEQNAIDLCKKGIAEGLDNALGGMLKETIEDELWHIKRLNELIERFGSASIKRE